MGEGDVCPPMSKLVIVDEKIQEKIFSRHQYIRSVYVKTVLSVEKLNLNQILDYYFS